MDYNANKMLEKQRAMAGTLGPLQPSGAAANSPEPNSPIWGKLIELEQTLGSVFCMVDALGQRFKGVLAPTGPVAQSGNGGAPTTRPPSSPVQGKVDELLIRVSQLGYAVNDLLIRSEV